MCGILGYLAYDASIDRGVIKNARNLLKHRGPDDEGLEVYTKNNYSLAFSHTRLSILDLSEAGHQPMDSRNGRYSITFNGEIYNYKELRKELVQLGHNFVSDSDTEVLINAWSEWNISCLPKLNGMFAFSIYDRKLESLFCVRDAFGIKPFFYSRTDTDFIFASEIPALLALINKNPRLNWQRSYDYLVHGSYENGSETFFSDVSSLKPGHFIQIDLKKNEVFEPSRWWIPSIEQRYDLNFEEASYRTRDNFLDSIRLHLRSDVPIGAALSGGIDSSAVVCAMRHIEPEMPIHTFSYIAAGSKVNEEKWVSLVNNHVDAVEHRIVVSPEELANDLDQMIRAQNEPFGSTSIYAQYRVFKLARDNGVTVTLDGQGADEMLAGYFGYPGQRVHSLLDKREIIKAIKFLNNWSNWPNRSKYFGIQQIIAQLTDGGLYQALRQLSGRKAMPRWLNHDLLNEDGVKVGYPILKPEPNRSGRRVASELAHQLTARGLPALLRHGDRNSMYFSIESRVPFLTIEQAELMLSLPEEYLISMEGETKSIFRSAMRGIVPDEILNRRDKIGFQTPEEQWLLSIESTVRGWLEDDIDVPFFNQKEVVNHFDLICSGKLKFSWQVWRWINFIRWHQIYFS